MTKAKTTKKQNSIVPTIKTVEDMLKHDLIVYDLLGFYFHKGDEIYWRDEDGELCGGVVEKVDYRKNFFSTYCAISAKYISSNGKNFFHITKELNVPFFSSCPLKEFEIKKMNANIKSKLIERGKLYTKLANDCTFMQYNGVLSRTYWFTRVHFKADGRLMVDRRNMGRMDANYFRYFDEETSDPMDEVSENKLWMCDSRLHAFSFTCKQWGEIKVSGLSEIKFDKNAFETLVLDEEKKKMIVALVKHSNVAFSDIITGKGGGCIFLLHGKPGTGKTLTAEAVAEVLKRPLYSVTIGELGISPDQLEDRLRSILEMASMWNAVLLLDEADIFIEKRDDTNILRNAMVGIFLRLLEYHQGVLFLTTNKAKHIDPAMRSRISIALNYEDHGEDTRRKIWENLLKAAGIKLNLNSLVKHPVNGRQIKNAIRIAQSLAINEGVPTSEKHILSCIEATEEFERQMTASI